MSVFCYKQLPTATRLGERLKKERETQGLSFELASAKTRLPHKFLAAIEAGAFCDLPKSKGYRLAYVKEYAEVLGLDRDAIVRQMITEAGLKDAPPVHPTVGVRHFPFASLASAARAILGIAAVVLLIGYLGWQVAGIIQPPHLAIYTPPEGAVVSNPAVIIQGEAAGASKLSVNGQEIMVTENGTFETTVDLSRGVNTITINASKKYGKTTSVIRHIVVKPAASPLGLNNFGGDDKVGL